LLSSPYQAERTNLLTTSFVRTTAPKATSTEIVAEAAMVKAESTTAATLEFGVEVRVTTDSISCTRYLTPATNFDEMASTAN
jgi:hypothetical protein